jgi:NADH-quinone oxidoreductase chain G
MIEIIINNNKYVFEKNITVLQACEQANINVPRFCYHEKLSVAGNCRMCLVEVEKSPKPVASCAMPISNGMVIFTETPLVKKAREAVLEFLLINHPLDCPICDQGGECDLQDLTLNYGSDRSRFFEVKHGVEDKDCGPIIKTIMTRCIHCTRCVRFLGELAGVEVFGALGRGELMEIGSFLDKYIHSEISGNLVDLCPVGALTSKPYAFLARNWELKKVESVDFSDGFGSNIVIHVRNFLNTGAYKGTTFKNVAGDQILRILPKLNNDLNENWISDKTRFYFDGNSYSRANSINMFENNLKVSEWNLTVFKKISLKTSLTGIIGSMSSAEEIYFLYQFLNLQKNLGLTVNNKLYFFNTDLPSFYQFNSNFANIENSDLIFLVGTNLRFESSMLNLKIRKHFFNKEVPVYSLGNFQNQTYPLFHLGNSPKILIKIAEGSHSFCKILRKSLNPLIIIGSEIGFRKDSKALQNVLRYISQKNFLNLKNFSGLNTIHSSTSLVNVCELGLALYANSTFYQQSLNKNFLFENKSVFLNNVDEDLTKTLKNINSQKNDVYFLDTHLNFKLKKNLMNKRISFPVTTLFERDSILINSEGRVQKAYKSVTSNLVARNSEDVLSAINFIFNKNKVCNMTLKNLYLNAPFLNLRTILRDKFYFNFLSIKEFQHKIYFTVFNPVVTNFYMTNTLSQNSKTMAECALFLKNKSNFL